MPLDDSSSGLDSVLKQVGSLSQEIGKRQAPEMHEMRSLEKQGKEALTSLQAETNRKMPEPPKMAELPKPPNTTIPNPAEAIGQPLTILAIFASALTRAPLTTALNSAASAMDSYHKGNIEAAKMAQQQYKDAIDQAFKQHQAEMEDYRALMEEHGQTIRGKAAVLEAIGAAHGWQESSRLAKAGQVDQALKIVEMRDKAFERVKNQKYLGRLQDETERHNKQQEDIARQRNALLMGKATGKVDQQVAELKNLKSDVDEIVQMVDADPSLVGAKGMFRRGMQAVVGQTSDEAAHDKDSAELHARVTALQARLMPLIKAKYFSGPAHAMAEQLVPGLDKFDDPVKVTEALKQLDRMIEQDIATKSQVSGAVNQNIKDLSNEELLRQLGLQ